LPTTSARSSTVFRKWNLSGVQISFRSLAMQIIRYRKNLQTTEANILDVF
jgi:hypothetical protein